MNRKWTMPIPALVMLVIFIGVGIYDFALVTITGTGSTVSNWMVEMNLRAPFWLNVICLVVGHFSFKMYNVCPKCGEKVE